MEDAQRITPSGRPGWVALRPGLRELGIFAAALVAYQASRAVVVGDAASATARAWDLLRLERDLGLDVERAVQEWAAATPGLIDGLNVVYLAAHLPVTAAFFVWLYRRRRPAYRLLRDGFLAANAIALCVFVALPTAPPRLLEGAGLADTLLAESGVDLHGGALSGWFNPYAAVPSMHVGYALLVGAGLVTLARAPAVRAAGLAYPALILLTITATGNHFVLDAAAGAAVMGLGVGGVAAARRARRLVPAARVPAPLAPAEAGADVADVPPRRPTGAPAGLEPAPMRERVAVRCEARAARGMRVSGLAVETEGLGRRFGEVRAVDGVDLGSRAARSTASSAPTAPARRPSDALHPADAERGPCPWWGATTWPPSPTRSGS